MDKQTVLVTGGAGFIGSHACVELLQAGYPIIVLDNLSNSKLEALKRVEHITGKAVPFYQADIRDQAALTDIFAKQPIKTVMHFAGLKAVGESCEQPLNYYHNNVYGTLVLLQAMQAANIKQMVFSSSATVYQASPTGQYAEDMPLGSSNPYGRTKAMIEDILRDVAAVDTIKPNDEPWKIALLRYFNPIGAHASGLIGEDPNGIPDNLMPYVLQVAIGKLKQLSIFGNDYPTPDGTGIRDYIHVVGLVKGHIKAIEMLESNTFSQGGCQAYNLGTGTGYSVLDIVNSFERVTGQKINYRFTDRRAGDLAETFANPKRAANQLGWVAAKNLDDMIADAWHWQQKNPQGYVTDFKA